MIITKKSLPRRAFLRGLGTTLALPLLDSMIPALSVASATKAPVRLGFVFHPVGMILDKWMPTTEGTGFEFTPTMKALEPFREHLTVFTGLAQVQGRALGDGAGDHAREGATWLTGVHPKKTEGVGHSRGHLGRPAGRARTGQEHAIVFARTRSGEPVAGGWLRLGL